MVAAVGDVERAVPVNVDAVRLAQFGIQWRAADCLSPVSPASRLRNHPQYLDHRVCRQRSGAPWPGRGARADAAVDVVVECRSIAVGVAGQLAGSPPSTKVVTAYRAVAGVCPDGAGGREPDRGFVAGAFSRSPGMNLL